MNTPNDSSFSGKDPVKEISQMITSHKDHIYANFKEIFNVLGQAGMGSYSKGFESDFAKPFLNTLSKLKENLDKLSPKVDSDEARLKGVDIAVTSLSSFRKELIKISENFNDKFSKYVLSKEFLAPAVLVPFSLILKEIDSINSTIENFVNIASKEVGSAKTIIKDHKESIDPIPEDMDDQINQMLGMNKRDTGSGIDSILDQFSKGEITKEQMQTRMKEFANSIGNLTRKSSVIVPIQRFGNFKF